MLTILDRYIIKKFLTTFFFVVLVMSLLAVVIDFSQNVEEFIDEKLPLKQVMLEHYMNFVLFINGMLWPLFAMLSVIFFTSRMAYSSEIISIFNAGVSFRRFMRPYLIAGGFIAIVHLIANHYIIPLSNKTRLEFYHAYIMKEKSQGKTRDIHFFISPDTKIFVRDYFMGDSVAHKFRVEKFEGNQLVSYIESEQARWEHEKQKWQLTGYEIHAFDNLKESIVVGGNEKLDTAIALKPQDFIRYDDTKEMIPSGRLASFIEEEKKRGTGNTKLYEIELQRRTADPVATIIVTLIGVAVASRKVRGGMGLHLAMGVALCAIFIFIARFSITFATNEALPSVIGVWLPNILFGAIAAILIGKAQK